MARASRQAQPPLGDLEAPARNGSADFRELWRPDESAQSCHGPEGVLVQEGHVTEEQLGAAIERQRENPRQSVLDVLVASGVVDSNTALQAVAKYFGLPFSRLQPGDVDPKVFERLPTDYLRAKRVVPISEDDGAVTVGLSEPADIFLIEDVGRRLGCSLRLVVTPPEDVLNVIEELASDPSEQVNEIIKDIEEDSVEVVEDKNEELTDLELAAGESPVIRYVNYLISSAVKEGASDIHIEPTEDRLRVRFRVDGVLFDQQAPPMQMHAAIISRLKIMANLDISERRLPQDGRIRATVQGRTVDLRVSTLPLTTGEKCVIRILDNRSISVGLENLGMGPDALADFRQEVLQPHGIVLVTGPTGSGKSTTLYSSLAIMDGDKLNISTVEDPVEYELSYANQVNVHDSIGMTFAAALRSLLRQDPDVIMVGEIRDEETARIAIQAALTGHLVLSTLHTNDAPSSITRLINIGIEPFLISAAVNAVLAQRLVRRICEDCKTPVKQASDTAKAFTEQAGIEVEQFYCGAGCPKCRQTGYKGRTGLYELFLLSDELRDLITGNPALGELRRATRKAGMRNLREDGLEKVAAGVTTVEEIIRATQT